MIRSIIASNYLRMSRFVVLLLSIFAGITFATAQVTTGTLRGTVTDSTGAAVPYATVKVIQRSNGFVFGTATQENGDFSLNQLSPDQSYTLEVSSIGYNTYIENNISIQLGESLIRQIILQTSENRLNDVLITIDANDPLFYPKKGNEQTVSAITIATIPTLNRSIQDMTGTLPEAHLNSFGGANYRFNNLSIDGSASNDVVGFQEPASGAAGNVASGTPGGVAGTQPIGFGAIGALSVKTAPFDVTYGNFTGASLNAVTKSGTNTTQATVYSFGRNAWISGKEAAGVAQLTDGMYDLQSGFSVGGPIKTNKLFYFLNAEYTAAAEPLANNPGSVTSNIPLEVVTLIADTLQSRYGYDPGIYTNAENQRSSTKLFLRLDANLSEKHKLTLRNNFVKGFADYLEWSPNFFNFGNQAFRHHSNYNSLVGELKTIINTDLYNKLVVSHSYVNDYRSFEGEVFPHLEITYNTANTIFAGTYREASIYELFVHTFQFTDNLTWYKNKHSVTAGLTAEYNAIDYNFLTAWNGRWQYASIEDFLNDEPSRVRGVYNSINNDYDYNAQTPSASYGVLLGALYIQDELNINRRLSFLLGLRSDIQWHPGEFPLREELQQVAAFAHYTNDINSLPQINPRLGFNYKLNKNRNFVLRGGTGTFTGRMPFVWYAYAHYISGTTYFNIDYKPSDPLPITGNLADLASLQPGLTEVNLIDSGFQIPRDWKSNLAIDWKLADYTLFTLEGTYTNTLQGLMFTSVNRKDSIGTFSGADNRPYYLATGNAIKLDTNYTNVFVLTNVDEGYRYTITASLSHKGDRYSGYAGYTFGESKDISSTVRNSHAANFEWNQALVANDPELAYSNFDIRHKIVTYHFLHMPVARHHLEIGLIYRAVSGSPFSYVYEGDVNRDGSAKNDLLFVPETADDIVLTDITDESGVVLVDATTQWQQLDAYISQDAYLSGIRGEYAARNAARTPWNHQLNLRLAYEIPFEKSSLKCSFDIFNLPNMLNSEWGAQYFVPNTQNAGYGLLQYVKITDNQPVYQFYNPTGTPWQIDPFSSRWQGQLGLQWMF
jgi:hypothetical protein